ncbi:helix-turn-helix transcriptional regulator [Vibrio parahaemolyticus]|uniref:helix-turn-helix transcriptional regulator n=1 Tax=Vibrio harveyi group TaxID=717610 RepID=UPI000470983B|nr:helix-turn-helix transcriptional regulator [Vibrio parahaemolyticus]HCZ9281401.1 helix-turn-helix transcriptional regulator [Vibrio alginolyticus]HCZ9393510.1 helix-turn-helix transcriptional regulator [Vibrio alginolyticus]
MESNPIPIRLKQARVRAGITQKKLGVMIGMDESSASGRMNHYEKGRHTPDISTLKKVADVLGVPLNYFFCEDEVSASLACKIARMNDAERKALLHKLESDIDSPTKSQHIELD